jgi:hypothetical protein
MAEGTNEVIFEILKDLQKDAGLLKDSQSEIKHELISMRGHLISISQDINNIYGILSRHDQRLDRIERRPELCELAEPQRPFDPNT